MDYQKLEVDSSGLSRYELYDSLKKNLDKNVREELKAVSYGVIEPDSLKDFDSGMRAIKAVKLAQAVEIVVFALLAILSIPMGANTLMIVSLSVVAASLIVYAVTEVVECRYMSKKLNVREQQEVVTELIENITEDMSHQKGDCNRYKELELHKDVLSNIQAEDLTMLNRNGVFAQIAQQRGVNLSEHDSEEKSYRLIALGVAAIAFAILVVLSLLQFGSSPVSAPALLKAFLIRMSIGSALGIVAGMAIGSASHQLGEREVLLNESQAQRTLEELRREVERKQSQVARGNRRYYALSQIKEALIQTSKDRKIDDSLVTQDNNASLLNRFFSLFQKKETNLLMTEAIVLDN